MPDSDSTETEEKIESQEESLTVAQRINRLGIIPEITGSPETTGSPEITGPIGAHESCVICGGTRIRPDPTGLVCSNPECLSRLKENYDELEKKTKARFYKLLEEIAKIIGMHISESEDVEKACEEMALKLSGITGDLEELVLAPLICVDLSSSTDNLSQISEKLQTEAERIAEALRKKEEKTD